LRKLKVILQGPASGFILLLAITAAAGSPLRLVAEGPKAAQDTPAAASGSPETGKDAQPAGKADEQAVEQTAEERQNQAFLLEGPVVKWTARTFNLSLEKTAVLFEIVNFLIIALAIGIPLLRILPGILRQRKQKLSGDLESARKVSEDANARLGAVEDKLSRLDEEIQKMRAEVESQSHGDEERIKASFEEESGRIVASAELEIALAANQARRSLRAFAADLAIDQAVRELNLTPEIDRALIAEFAGDLSRGGSGRGGQN
jgi:F-type H+-transporting ATPase subunit b